MKKIYKYTWDFPEKVLYLPRDSEFLSCQVQDGRIVFWFKVDPHEEDLVKIPIAYYGTGWEVEGKHSAFIATVQLDGYVWHLFSEEGYFW